MSDLKADLILCNANVITMNPSSPRAQLVAIRNGKIFNVLVNETIKELGGDRTKVIKL